MAIVYLYRKHPTIIGKDDWIS